MIQSDFSSMIGPKTIGFSGSQFRFVVEALDDPAGELSFGPEPVQQQGPMFPQSAGNLLHWLNLRAHRFCAPFVQKLPCPIRRSVRPEELKLLLQEIASNRFQVVLQKVRQFGFLSFRQVLRPFEQQPAALGQHRFITLILQLFRLLGAHFVNRLVQVGHDVEPVQDVDGMSRLLGNHLQIGFPHIATDKTQHLGPFLAKPAEEPQQGFDLSPRSNPQQPFAMGIDLVDQCQVPVAPLPLDLVDTDGLYTRQVPVFPAPGDGHLHRTENVVPGGTEGTSYLFPAKTPGPSGQKPGVGLGQSMFSCHPGHLLHPDTATWAVYPARGIEQKRLDAPHRDEFKTSDRQPVVARPSAPAFGTDRPAVRARAHLNLYRWDRSSFDPGDGSVHKRFEFLDSIEDSLYLHPVPFSLVDGCFATSIFSEPERDAPPSRSPVKLSL